MSLDSGVISGDSGVELTSSAMEEDYCLHGRERHLQQWRRTGVFKPSSLRVYGVIKEPSLTDAIRRTNMLGATFGTCSLGRLQSCEKHSPRRNSRLTASKSFEDAAHVVHSPDSCTINDSVPFSSLLVDPSLLQSKLSETQNLKSEWHREMVASWSALQTPSEWCHSITGVVSEELWTTSAQRQRITEQLELAAFMCLGVVRVSLPTCTSDFPSSDSENEEEEEEEEEDGCSTENNEMVSPKGETQRNIRVACLAADLLHAFILKCAKVRVWVGCDAGSRAHRHQMQRLRNAILYGYSVQRTASHRKVYSINTPGSVTGTSSSSASGETPSSWHGTGRVNTEAAASLKVYLYNVSSTLSSSLPAEWLGEDVVGFTCPSPVELFVLLAPHGVAPHEHPHYHLSPPLTGAKSGQGSSQQDLLACSRHDTATEVNPSQGTGSGATSTAAVKEAIALPPSDASPVVSGDGRRLEILRHRYTYMVPKDLQSMSASRWAGTYPPFVSLLTFIVELLRRRAMPVFNGDFFDQYPLLNYLCLKFVEEPIRDVFAPYEDQIQLPLQPLSHHLSSGVYEVFERDTPKYRQYREAVFNYVQDWYVAGAAQQHAQQNSSFFAKHGVVRQTPISAQDERTLHIVVLGCGRGPLIGECLNAVSALGIRLRIFAIEKHRLAASFTSMRWISDPEWAQMAYTFGHTLEVIAADGRTIAAASENGSLTLPPDFGLCDLIVSELLGSFGDNELSPECLEAFHAQLKVIQHRRGIAPNPHLVCIPQQYTSWLAPMMSVPFEAAVREAAIRGLTVPPPGCKDPHGALYHTLLVTNLSKAVTLAPPRSCWTFEHAFNERNSDRYRCNDDTMEPRPIGSLERSVTLIFHLPPHGHISGFVGYFSAVLYQSATAPPIIISTAPVDRTKDMYSWFPCVFPIEPLLQVDLEDKMFTSSMEDDTIPIGVQLNRRVNAEERRVWYEWSVSYGGRAASAEYTVHNKDGWAASMLL